MKLLDIGFFIAFDRPFNPVDDWSYASLGDRNGARHLRSVGSPTWWSLAPWCSSSPRCSFPRWRVLRLTGFAAPITAGSSLRGGRGAHRRLGRLLGVRRRSSSPARASRPRAGPTSPCRRCTPCNPTSETEHASSPRSGRPLSQHASATGSSPACAARTSCSCSSRATGSSRSRAPPSRPSVDAVLDAGTEQLAEAGFSARSGWLTSSTFGGGSWLRARDDAVGHLGRHARVATTSSSRATASRSRRPSDRRDGGRSPTIPRTPGLAGRHVLLPLRPDLRPPEPRVSRPEVRVRLDAGPVRAARPAAARAGEGPPPPHLLRDRSGLEPHALDPHPAHDPLEPRRRRLDLQPAAHRRSPA